MKHAQRLVFWKCIEQKCQWTATTRKLMSWPIFFAALKKQTTTLKHQQLLKHFHGWLPTGHEVHRHNNPEDHRCPHCRRVHEKNPHILRCPHPDRHALQTRFLTVHLNNFYHRSDTAQPIRRLISQSLIQWFNQPGTPHRRPRGDPLRSGGTRARAVCSSVPDLPAAMRSLHWFHLTFDEQIALGTALC
jgi:hypothetical protein